MSYIQSKCIISKIKLLLTKVLSFCLSKKYLQKNTIDSHWPLGYILFLKFIFNKISLDNKKECPFRERQEVCTLSCSCFNRSIYIHQKSCIALVNCLYQLSLHSTLNEKLCQQTVATKAFSHRIKCTNKPFDCLIATNTFGFSSNNGRWERSGKGTWCHNCSRLCVLPIVFMQENGFIKKGLGISGVSLVDRLYVV